MSLQILVSWSAGQPVVTVPWFIACLCLVMTVVPLLFSIVWMICLDESWWLMLGLPLNTGQAWCEHWEDVCRPGERAGTRHWGRGRKWYCFLRSPQCPLSPIWLAPVKIKLRSARIVRSKSQQEHFVFIVRDALGNGLRDESIISEMRRGLHLTDASFETLKTHDYAQCVAMLWV